jgi:hypothetical protein
LANSKQSQLHEVAAACTAQEHGAAAAAEHVEPAIVLMASKHNPRPAGKISGAVVQRNTACVHHPQPAPPLPLALLVLLPLLLAAAVFCLQEGPVSG